MDGGDGANHDKTIVNQMMLRFRPIAPKPVTGGSGNAYSDLEKRKEIVGKNRVKRKYVRVNKIVKRSQVTKKKKNKVCEFDETVVTLGLLPEIGKSSSERLIDFSLVQKLPGLFEISGNRSYGVSDLRVVESWVTLECVTKGSADGVTLGCTDVEKVSYLEKDTCPGFVSDGDGGVRWVNLAYRKMVGTGKEDGEPPEVLVWLAVKEKIPAAMETFSCRVRVVYGGGGRGKVVPCDAWRMEFGGYAWRLDVEAALSLGR